MTERQQQPPIARRELRRQMDDGTIVPIYIEIFAPVAAEDGAEYRCRYRIEGLKSQPIDQVSMGLDGIQALHLSIQTIASWLAAASNDIGVLIQWENGETYDNLELCTESTATRLSSARAPGDAEASLDREIEAAYASIRTDPSGAERAFKRLKRRAVRHNLIKQTTSCIHGQLAVARAKHDSKAALRFARIIVEREPSVENILMFTRELEKGGRPEETRQWYERALTMIDKETSLYSFIAKKLAKL